MPNVTTSVSFDLWNKAKSMNIKWNEALTRGIQAMLEEPFKKFEGENIDEESWKSKCLNIQKNMQGSIDDLNKQLEDKKHEGKN